MRLRKPLLLVVIVGLVLRVGLLIFFWSEPLTIGDEIHYQLLAENILNHQEFSYTVGQPHALRPPFYPAFMSVIYFITGGVDPNAVRITQLVLSLGIIIVVYQLGRTLFDHKTGILASLTFAVYPSFVFFTHLLLTEVLFTFFLLLFLYYFFASVRSDATGTKDSTAALSSKKSTRNMLLAGFFLGLGALTRSILFPFLLVTILFVFLACRGLAVQKIRWVTFLVLGFSLVVGVWTVRNYFLFKDLMIIDSIGGMNLYLGNYEHTPLNRAWAAIEFRGEKAWFHGHEEELEGMNEAQKLRWATRKAKEFILEHKMLTMKRDLIKAASFWGLERAVIGQIIAGKWPRLNKTSYLIGITFIIFAVYSIVLMASVFGIMFHLRYRKTEILFCATMTLFFTAIHAIVYGHSRYHLPLMPLLGIFASWCLLNMKDIWEDRRSWRQIVAATLASMLIGVWVREIFFVEGARFLKSLHL